MELRHYPADRSFVSGVKELEGVMELSFSQELMELSFSQELMELSS